MFFKTKIGNTEYGIGWLPLGGYVKIAGMIDESMDKEQMALPPQPWEFRSKPAWQRLIIMLGGVTVNLFLGIFIYSMTLYTYGDKYLPIENMEDGIWCTDELATNLGFQNGDKIISKPVEKKGKRKLATLKKGKTGCHFHNGDPFWLERIAEEGYTWQTESE